MLLTGTASGRLNVLGKRSYPIVTLRPNKALDKSLALLELIHQHVLDVFLTDRIMGSGMVRYKPAAFVKLDETIRRIKNSEGILLNGPAGGFVIQCVYDGQYFAPESIYRKFPNQLRAGVPVFAQPGS